MSLQFETKHIYRTDGSVREGAGARSAFESPIDQTIFRSDRDLLSRPKRAIIPKDSSSLQIIDQVNRTIFVSNTEPEDWAVTADVVDATGVATIDYLITEFRGRGVEAFITPLELVTSDPDKFLSPEAALRLLSLSAHTLGQHAIRSTLLIPYLQHSYSHYSGPDPLNELLKGN